MVVSSLRLDSYSSSPGSQAIGEEEGYSLPSHGKASGDDEDLSCILKSLPPSYFRPSSARGDQSSVQGSSPTGDVTVESLLAELDHPSSNYGLSSAGIHLDSNTPRGSAPLLSSTASARMENILVQGQNSRLGKENPRIGHRPKKTTISSPLPKSNSRKNISSSNFNPNDGNHPRALIRENASKGKRENISKGRLPDRAKLEQAFDSPLLPSQPDNYSKKNERRLTNETKRKVENRVLSERNDERGNQPFTNLQSDSDEGYSPQNESRREDGSMSIKVQEQQPENTWAYRQRALITKSKDLRTKTDHNIVTKSDSSPIDLEIRQQQRLQKRENELEDKWEVDPSTNDKIIKDGELPISDDSYANWEHQITKVLNDSDAKKQFLMRPLGFLVLIQCTVTRFKGPGSHLHPRYILRLANSELFIMAARKRKKSRTSYYILSTSEDEITRDSHHSIGKLRSNYLGTEYVLYASCGQKAVPSRHQKQPRKGIRRRGTGSDEEDEEECVLKRELGVVLFKQSSFKLKSGSPRKLLVVQPVPHGQHKDPLDTNCAERVSYDFDKVWIPSKPEDSMLQVFKKAQGKKWGDTWSGLRKDLLVYRNKEPEWDDELNAFCLDFGGRVTKTSAKNCQITALGDEGLGLVKGDIILQFGKTSGNTFSLDFRYPLCPMLAFSVALASMDDKFANII